MITVKIEDQLGEIQLDKGIALTQRADYIKTLCKAYGHKYKFLKQYSNNRLTHYMPFVIISLPVLGKKIVSMPYDASYGGCVNMEGIPPSEAFYKELVEFAIKNNIERIEIRLRNGNDYALEKLGFVPYKSLISSELNIFSEKINFRMCTKGHKWSINKSKKNALEISTDCTKKNLEEFYNLMSINMREYGTPMYPYKYFESMWDKFHSSGNLVLIEGIYKNKVISGLLLLIDMDTAIYKYGAANKKYLGLAPYHGMVWEAIKICIDRNCKTLNMGTSFLDDEGLIYFKNAFGSVSFPVYNYIFSINGERVRSVNEYRHKLEVLLKLWKWQPLFMTKWLGNLIWKWYC